MAVSPRKPSWLKVRAPGGDAHHALSRRLRQLKLHTVCEEARCPNMGECWRAATATLMLLGEVCTRGCRFCAVSSGDPAGRQDPREPVQVARAVRAAGWRHVVLTMVNRDDLLDGGAEQVARTVRTLHRLDPPVAVEVLAGDFAGKRASVITVVDAAPEVFAHNVEVVRAVTRSMRDARCSYDRSLEVLRWAKRLAPERLTKSSLMVGVGETDSQLLEALWDLRSVGVDLVTIGQYLRPTRHHAPVQRWVEPESFARYQQAALEMGFAGVASGPLVRSSYHAAELVAAARSGGSTTGGQPGTSRAVSPPPALPGSKND